MNEINTLGGFTTAELTAEISRRAEAEEAEIRRVANQTYRRVRLAGDLSSARMDLARAEDEHAKRTRNHDALLKLNMAVRPDEVRNAEIAVDQANRARSHAQDRVIAAERALDTFDRQEAA